MRLLGSRLCVEQHPYIVEILHACGQTGSVEDLAALALKRKRKAGEEVKRTKLAALPLVVTREAEKGTQNLVSRALELVGQLPEKCPPKRRAWQVVAEPTDTDAAETHSLAPVQLLLDAFPEAAQATTSAGESALDLAIAKFEADCDELKDPGGETGKHENKRSVERSKTGIRREWYRLNTTSLGVALRVFRANQQACWDVAVHSAAGAALVEDMQRTARQHKSRSGKGQRTAAAAEGVQRWGGGKGKNSRNVSLRGGKGKRTAAAAKGAQS